jgi:hypothetical protein
MIDNELVAGAVEIDQVRRVNSVAQKEKPKANGSGFFVQ